MNLAQSLCGMCEGSSAWPTPLFQDALEGEISFLTVSHLFTRSAKINTVSDCFLQFDSRPRFVRTGIGDVCELKYSSFSPILNCTGVEGGFSRERRRR
jgi:hypothetical protein